MEILVVIAYMMFMVTLLLVQLIAVLAMLVMLIWGWGRIMSPNFPSFREFLRRNRKARA